MSLARLLLRVETLRCIVTCSGGGLSHTGARRILVVYIGLASHTVCRTAGSEGSYEAAKGACVSGSFTRRLRFRKLHEAAELHEAQLRACFEAFSAGAVSTPGFRKRLRMRAAIARQRIHGFVGTSRNQFELKLFKSAYVASRRTVARSISNECCCLLRGILRHSEPGLTSSFRVEPRPVDGPPFC